MSRRNWTRYFAESAGISSAAFPPRHQASKRRSTPRHKPKLIATALEPVPTPAIQVVEMTLMGKPRMTQRDRWAKRDCVLRYRAQSDELQLRKVVIPETYALIIFLPMPRSWSNKVRAARNGERHDHKPDRDNLEKGLLDGLCKRDEHLHRAFIDKRWAVRGRFVLADLSQVDISSVDELIARHLPR